LLYQFQEIDHPGNNKSPPPSIFSLYRPASICRGPQTLFFGNCGPRTSARFFTGPAICGEPRRTPAKFGKPHSLANRFEEVKSKDCCIDMSICCDIILLWKRTK